MLERGIGDPIAPLAALLETPAMCNAGSLGSLSRSATLLHQWMVFYFKTIMGGHGVSSIKGLGASFSPMGYGEDYWAFLALTL